MADLKFHSFAPSAWIEVSGEDAFTFLQGQFSNDLKRSEECPVTYGLLLDAKGKIEGDGFVLGCREEAFYLFSYYSPAASLMERLERYIIADDVEAADVTSLMRGAAVWGTGARDCLERLGLPVPAAGTFERKGDAWVVPGRRSPEENFDVLFPEASREWAGNRVEAVVRDMGGSGVDEAACHYERIRAGLPAIPVDLGKRNLPHEGGLADSAVSYAKGCYTGQEVMARLRHSGQARRSLVPARIDGVMSEVPCPIYFGEKEAGRVTSLGKRDGEQLGFVLVLRSILKETRSFSFEPSGKTGIHVLDDFLCE